LFRLSNTVARPVSELVDYSHKFASGEYSSRPHIDSDDDFGLIAENFTRSSERISRAVHNQEAQENLQKSVTEFLTVVSQIARGDLTLRGRVTNDALGNVVDSVNYMLDNFAKVLERVRKAAIDVSSSANEILLSSEDMAKLRGALSMPPSKAIGRSVTLWRACSAFELPCRRLQKRSSRWAIARSKFQKLST
jgi:twitching motility protein PilJ